MNLPTPANPPAKKRCTIYVDGFNLYYGVLEDNPQWKWLNLQTFFEALRPDEEVVAVKYFTAEIEPEKRSSPKRDRQKRYFRALRMLPKIHLIFGRYQLRWVTCRAQCRQKYQTPEEKKTDVNIAVAMINDTLQGLTDTMVLVSGDSDIEPAVKWIRENHPEIKITVYVPVLPDNAHARRNDHYLSMGVACRPLPLALLSEHILSDVVVMPDGTTLTRPAEWAESFPEDDRS